MIRISTSSIFLFTSCRAPAPTAVKKIALLSLKIPTSNMPRSCLALGRPRATLELVPFFADRPRKGFLICMTSLSVDGCSPALSTQANLPLHTAPDFQPHLAFAVRAGHRQTSTLLLPSPQIQSLRPRDSVRSSASIFLV